MKITITMPRIKFNKQDTKGPRDNRGGQRRGLRSSQEDIFESYSGRTSNDDFDMYRNDDRRPKRTSKRRGGGESGHIQFWYAASLIAALGAFCIFVDSVIVSTPDVSMTASGLSILMGSIGDTSRLPACVTYLSAMPLINLMMFGVFAVMKENAFKKGSLALIVLSVFEIVLLIRWSSQIMSYNTGYLTGIYPGTAVLIEIGCCVAMVAVIIAQMVVSRFSSDRMTNTYLKRQGGIF